MLQSFTIEIPLNLEVWIVFGFNSSLKMEFIILTQAELWLQRNSPNGFGELWFWLVWLTRSLALNCCFNFIDSIKTLLSLRMLSIQVNVGFGFEKKLKNYSMLTLLFL